MKSADFAPSCLRFLGRPGSMEELEIQFKRYSLTPEGCRAVVGAIAEGPSCDNLTFVLGSGSVVLWDGVRWDAVKRDDNSVTLRQQGSEGQQKRLPFVELQRLVEIGALRQDSDAALDAICKRCRHIVSSAGLADNRRAQRRHGHVSRNMGISPDCEAVLQEAVKAYYADLNVSSFSFHSVRLKSICGERDMRPSSYRTFRRRIKSFPIVNLLRTPRRACAAYQRIGLRSNKYV